ncbi:MAG TPA: toll/interleukin-1 receptor domain-containing protein [Thermoanaerobaculia bacterium]|jgi:hypothetical protein|nr:toll/interleukin-1 receptor domain-containing protein [Thermoanaerobaculia bacterium]
MSRKLAAGYTWDAFLSYTSGPGMVLDWVDNHFLPSLTGWLEHELPHPPRIFVDRQAIKTGDYWRQVLLTELNRSKCMVAVWCLPYFRSPWCVAEWRTMMQRARSCQLRGELVYPVSFADGEYFPRAARGLQVAKLNEWNFPQPAFQNTPAYLKFQVEMQRIAREVAAMIARAPGWSADFPVILPRPSRLPKIPDPRSMNVPRF